MNWYEIYWIDKSGNSHHGRYSGKSKDDAKRKFLQGHQGCTVTDILEV